MAERTIGRVIRTTGPVSGVRISTRPSLASSSAASVGWATEASAPASASEHRSVPRTAIARARASASSDSRRLRDSMASANARGAGQPLPTHEVGRVVLGKKRGEVRRVARRVLPQPLDGGGVQVGPYVVHQPARVLERQPGELDRHHPAPTGRPALPGRMDRRRHRAAGHRDQEPVPGRPLQHPGERLDRFAVGPLQVVEAQQHRPAVRMPVEQLVEELGAHEGGGGRCGSHPVDRAPLLEDAEGVLGGALEAARVEYVEPGGPVGQLVEERRLARALVALDHDDRRRTGRGSEHGRVDRAQLALLPEQHGPVFHGIRTDDLTRNGGRTGATCEKCAGPREARNW